MKPPAFTVVHSLQMSANWGLGLGLPSCRCGKSPQSQPSSVRGFFAIVTQIFLFFSNFYKHSCHMSGFPLLDSDVGLIASLLLWSSIPSVWRAEVSREDEALHARVSSGDAKRTRIYVFLKLPEKERRCCREVGELFCCFCFT